MDPGLDLQGEGFVTIQESARPIHKLTTEDRRVQSQAVEMHLVGGSTLGLNGSEYETSGDRFDSDVWSIERM